MRRTARIRVRGGLFAAAVLSGLVLLCGSAPGAERAAGQSLEIHLNRALDGAPVPNLEIQVYRAGIPAGENPAEENSVYRLSPDFRGAGTGDVLSEDLSAAAEQLAAFAGRQGMAGTAAVSDSRGTAAFRDLPEGLYLVTLDRRGEQKEDGARYEMNAFLVSVGGREGQGLSEAAPKIRRTVGVSSGTGLSRSSSGRTSGSGGGPGGGSGRVLVPADPAVPQAVLGESRGSGIPLPEVLGTSRLPKTGEAGAFSGAGRRRPLAVLFSELGVLAAILLALNTGEKSRIRRAGPGETARQAGKRPEIIEKRRKTLAFRKIGCYDLQESNMT